VNIFGNSNIEDRNSLSSHFVKRWRDRIGYATYDEIKTKVHNIVNNGTKYPIDNMHYRICYEGICVVFLKLSPLHSLAKTVYHKDEEDLSAI
jgi:hypothetical protein